MDLPGVTVEELDPEANKRPGNVSVYQSPDPFALHRHPETYPWVIILLSSATTWDS